MKAQIMNKYHLGAVSFLYTVSVTPRTGQENVLAQLDWWMGVGRKREPTTE